MAIKKWKCDYKTHQIEFVNEWDWSGNSKEELFIDWKSVFIKEKNMSTSTISDVFWTKIVYKFDNNTTLEVIGWSSWYLFWVAAKFLINWKQIWWDKIVLFGKS